MATDDESRNSQVEIVLLHHFTTSIAEVLMGGWMRASKNSVRGRIDPVAGRPSSP